MGISAVVAAMMGLSVLLLTGVLTWKDCLTYPPAWDTLFWFAVLVGTPPPPACVGQVHIAHTLYEEAVGRALWPTKSGAKESWC